MKKVAKHKSPWLHLRRATFLIFFFLVELSQLQAVEPGAYRLLSVSETSKLILVSEIQSKTRYVLDTSSAKITVNSKAAEFQDLKAYTVIHLTFELKKSVKDGIDVDGKVSEIRITTPADSAK